MGSIQRATGSRGAVESVNGHAGAVVLDADDLTDGVTNKMFTVTERTKLTGIAPSATAYTDEQAQDAAAALLTSGSHTGLTATYVDASNRVDLAVTSSGGSGYSTVRDEGTALTQRTAINFIGAGVTAADDAGNSRTNVTIPDPQLMAPPVHAVGNSGASLTIDAASGSGWVKTITLTANCTVTLTGAASGRATALELILTQDGTGGRTITWPGSVKWSGGAPTLSTAAGAVDRVVLTTYNAGTTWYADLIGKAYA